MEGQIDEVWKDIAGYENKYQISNLGRFRNSKIIMKPMVATNGYLIACLWKDGKQKKYLVHRLVAQAFLENPHNCEEVNHIDEDKTNNDVKNLEWCFHRYNMNYGSIKNRIAKSNSGKKITPDTMERLRNIAKDRIWFNNGIIEKLVKKEDVYKYSGWNTGRLLRK